MPRIAAGIEPTERDAAFAINDLANQIQVLCYYLSEENIAQGTIRACCKAYRVLKPIVLSYYGDNHTLVWDAPTYKFAKAKRC